jgi:gamma-glutamyltranspeptidase
MHLAVEALRLAFADAHRYVADPAYQAIPVEQLLSKEYASRRGRLVDLTRPFLNRSMEIPGSPYFQRPVLHQ